MIPYLLIVCLFLTPLQGMAETAPSKSGRETELRAVVMDYVKQKTAHLGAEIRIKRFSAPGNMAFPEGTLEYEVVAPQQWEGWGHVNLAVIVRQAERIVQNIPVRLDIESLVEMVVTTRQLDHGTIITQGDLGVRKLDIAAVQGRYLGRTEDAIGKKARMTIKANVPVKPDQLEKVPLIKSGQLVTIIAENARMRITVTGKAKSSGAEGDAITVQNLNSLKEFPARVIDAATVAVVF